MQGVRSNFVPLLRLSSLQLRRALRPTNRHPPIVRCGTTDHQQADLSTSFVPDQEEMGKGGPPRTRYVDMGFSVDKDAAFIDLQLRKIQEEVGRVRVRQHVNVLSARYQKPTPPPNWAELFEDPAKPLFVDIGCGYGRFLLQLSRTRADANFLGMEVRAKVATRGNEWAKGLGASHVFFAGINVNVNFATWIASYPGPLSFVSVQFPDPNFKRRHRKRRIVQPQLAREITEALAPGGSLFLQSDILDTSKDMRDTFEIHCGQLLEPADDHWDPERSGPHFATRVAEEPTEDVAAEEAPTEVAPAAAAGEARAEARAEVAADGHLDDGLPGMDIVSSGGSDDGGGSSGDDDDDDQPPGFQSRWAAELPGGGWLRANPLGVPTEREVATLSNGGGVYRMLLLKKR